MKTFDVVFSNEINDNLVKEFEKKIYFLSEKITYYSYVDNPERKIIIYLDTEDNEDFEKIKNHTNYVFKSEILGLKNVKNTVIWDTDKVDCANGNEVLKELLDKDLAIITGEGQVGFREPLVSLFDFLDTVLKNISTMIFGCQNYRFPTLLKTDVLKKVGYFDSFPNLLMFTTRLKNEIDNYRNFKKIYSNGYTEKNSADLINFCQNTNYGLPPTMCYYVYDMLSGKEISNCSFTAVGKSFRFENKYYKPFERLWDFTIRETVFLGDYDYIKDSVEKYKLCVIKLMEILELHGTCETANDPFFLVDEAVKKINVQKMFGSKYELRLRVNKDSSIAVGSFNIHGQFLSKRFDLFKSKNENEYIYTGCIGIGLERLLFAYLSQHGLEKIDSLSLIDINELISELRKVINV